MCRRPERVAESDRATNRALLRGSAGAFCLLALLLLCGGAVALEKRPAPPATVDAPAAAGEARKLAFEAQSELVPPRPSRDGALVGSRMFSLRAPPTLATTTAQDLDPRMVSGADRVSVIHRDHNLVEPYSRYRPTWSATAIAPVRPPPVRAVPATDELQIPIRVLPPPATPPSHVLIEGQAHGCEPTGSLSL